MLKKIFNEGFEIIKNETFYCHTLDLKEERIVMGRRKTRFGMQYVTWECLYDSEFPDDINYFWGHYFDDEIKCLADFHMRLANHYLRM